MEGPYFPTVLYHRALEWNNRRGKKLGKIHPIAASRSWVICLFPQRWCAKRLQSHSSSPHKLSFEAFPFTLDSVKKVRSLPPSFMNCILEVFKCAFVDEYPKEWELHIPSARTVIIQRIQNLGGGNCRVLTRVNDIILKFSRKWTNDYSVNLSVPPSARYFSMPTCSRDFLFREIPPASISKILFNSPSLFSWDFPAFSTDIGYMFSEIWELKGRMDKSETTRLDPCRCEFCINRIMYWLFGGNKKDPPAMLVRAEIGFFRSWIRYYEQIYRS